MANKEDLERFSQGVDGWNNWREAHSSIKIDLRGAYFFASNLGRANLRGVDLSEADLRWASLMKADLSKANLKETNLEMASFGEADLREADLRGANLGGAYLMDANLKGANLGKANLEGTKLIRANLSEANLVDAHFSKTDFWNADLSWADLSGANLSGAKLQGANLKRANLSEAKIIGATLLQAYLNGANIRKADLRESSLKDTDFGNVDLSETKGLEEVDHWGPSIISISTLQLSKGNIPEKFLRGCGLSDWEIESAKLYQPGLSADQVTDITYKVCQLRAGSPIQYYSVFISYSSKDQEFAQRLHNDLQENGVRCWFAPEDIQGGKKLHEQIDFAIQRNDRTLIILSKNSMNSEWVKTEIAKTRKKEVKEKRRVLFPIRLVDFKKIQEWECFDADMGKDSAREIREYFIPDFSNWQDEKSYRVAFERLLKDLRAREGVEDGESRAIREIIERREGME